VLPKPVTSGIEAKGRFGKQDFRYVAEEPCDKSPGWAGLAVAGHGHTDSGELSSLNGGEAQRVGPSSGETRN
jgi:hypothetical protein